jgi:Ca2+-binding EF-hand superfamily protein
LGDKHKELRRAFKQKDMNQSGHTSVKDFKDVIKSLKVSLNDEDMFHMIQRLDKDVSGMVNYSKFINEYLKSS